MGFRVLAPDKTAGARYW